MSLLSYLTEYFYDESQLLALANISKEQLVEFQHLGMMPKASYLITTSTQCQSYFGEHLGDLQQAYYAKGYACWLGSLQMLTDENDAFAYFSTRYQTRLTALKQQGHSSIEPKFSAQLAPHIASEWQHFLAGTYGLCTKSGLPEDIAAKELALAEIKALLDSNAQPDKARLARAVNLLDSASALFAPHERATSSRAQWIDQVRRQYQL